MNDGTEYGTILREGMKRSMEQPAKAKLSVLKPPPNYRNPVPRKDGVTNVEPRKRKLYRIWWAWKDDFGEFMAVMFLLSAAVAVASVAWMAVIEIERWFR